VQLLDEAYIIRSLSRIYSGNVDRDDVTTMGQWFPMESAIKELGADFMQPFPSASIAGINPPRNRIAPISAPHLLPYIAALGTIEPCSVTGTLPLSVSQIVALDMMAEAAALATGDGASTLGFLPRTVRRLCSGLVEPADPEAMSTLKVIVFSALVKHAMGPRRLPTPQPHLPDVSVHVEPLTGSGSSLSPPLTSLLGIPMEARAA
jgi:hypothetical protein